MEMADELVLPSMSSKSKFPLISQATLPKEENVTSIFNNSMKLEDLIRELVLSSEINVNENHIENIVRYDLSNLNVRNNASLSEKQVLEMSLRGYLGIINELLYLRYSILHKIKEIFNVELNILSRCLMKGNKNDYEQKTFLKSCFYLFKTKNVEKLETIWEHVSAELYERKTKLLEIYATEWQIIGKMKKELEKLVDNCRICEKKVKVHNLIEHSKYCEKRFKLTDEIKQTGHLFISKANEFYEIVAEQRTQSNIGSM